MDSSAVKEEQAKGPASRLAEVRQLGSLPHSNLSLWNGDADGGLGYSPLPKSIAKPLVDMLTAVVNGKTLVVLSIPKAVNIKRATSILNLNYSEMLNLLDEGEVQYRKVDGERVVPLSAIFDYKRRSKERARELINYLTRETQLMGLYEI